ncbi:MAG: TonB-dependent receptor [Proteobacteria bacterium]|nr:TonB-dependent receptor [Pseudomonadota bacterium]
MHKLFALTRATLIGTPIAQAEETAAGANRFIEEVVVVARKREETAQSVPIPITALSEEQLDNRNITEIQDLEKLSPNTSINYSAVNGTAISVFMRGIGQTNWSATQDPKIGIYVDDVYLSRPQGGLLDMMDVNRVEILRGPQGTLFGRNTTAGLIQIINNKPTMESETSIRLGAGTRGHQRYGFTINRALSDTVAARVALFGKNTDGYIINSVTGKDRGNEDSLSYRASLLWDLEQFSALLTYDHFESDERAPLGSCRFTGPDSGMLAGGLASIGNMFGIYDDMKANCDATTRRVSSDNTNDESANSDVDAYSLKLDYDMEWASLTSVSSYREINNFNGSWGWVMGAGPGVNFLEILNNESVNKVYSQELRLSGETDKLSWVAGAYIFQEDSDEDLDVPLFRDVAAPSAAEWPFFYFPTGAANPDGSAQTLGDIAVATQIYGSRYQAYDVTNKNQSLFAEVVYQINDQLGLTVGARYTSDDREFTRIQTLFGGAADPQYVCPGMTFTELAPGVSVSASDRCYQEVSYSKTTPRVILSYDLNDDVMLYGSYSMGYSSGGFNQDTRMRAYLPEISDNFEIGAKTSLMDGRLRLNATAFLNNYQNQQLTVGRVVNGQPTADLINAQEATLSGLEFDILSQLTENFAVAISAGYLQGEYNEFTVDDNTIDPVTLAESIVTRDLSDTEFGNDGSETSLDISLLHYLDLPSGGDITSSLGYSFKDDQYYTLLNTPSSFEPSYWLLDARVTWNLSNDQTRLVFWGSNLLDEEYVNTMIDQSGDTQIGGSDPSLGMTAVYWGAPRAIGLEISHSF